MYILDNSPLSDMSFANTFFPGCSLSSHSLHIVFCRAEVFNFFKFIDLREGEREREKHQCVVPLIYALIVCFLCVIESATLACRDNALSN